ncbi:hypothetical protein [Caldimonas tepidiphila]|uniref:hypothetical protein n=1 Tax=Caldimonas tepidiphila TaxID=2315841 RepID=UPI00130022EA|nr:hypothetical protein [Caldimonas tepidiphila]
MSGRRLPWRAGGVAALALAAAGAASADTLSAQTRNGNFTFQNAQGQVNVPVAPGTFESPTFAFIQGERLVVSYTAECAVAGGNNNQNNNSANIWMDLDIVARNVTTNVITVLPPTNGNNDAFCSVNHTPQNDGWQMNAVNAVALNLPTGIYRVEVRARLRGNGATSGHLGDSSLIVWK